MHTTLIPKRFKNRNWTLCHIFDKLYGEQTACDWLGMLRRPHAISTKIRSFQAHVQTAALCLKVYHIKKSNLMNCLHKKEGENKEINTTQDDGWICESNYFLLNCNAVFRLYKMSWTLRLLCFDGAGGQTVKNKHLGGVFNLQFYIHITVTRFFSSSKRPKTALGLIQLPTSYVPEVLSRG